MLQWVVVAEKKLSQLGKKASGLSRHWEGLFWDTGSHCWTYWRRCGPSQQNAEDGMRPLETLMICLYNSITLQSCSRNPQSPLGTGIRTGFFTIFLFPLKPRRTAGALFNLDSAHWTFSSMSCVSQTISAHILSILALLCLHIAKNIKTVKLSIFTVSHYGVVYSVNY